MQAILPLMAALSGLLCAPALAQSWQDTGQIEAAVESFLLDNGGEHPDSVEVQVQRIDPRIKLAACPDALEIEERTRDARATQKLLRVSCRGQTPWQIYVKAQVQAWHHVVVAKRTLNRGEGIRPGDLALEKKLSSRLRQGFFEDVKEVAGLRPKYAIRAGEVVTPSRVVREKLVQRGREVTLIAATGGLSVRTKAKALENATLGETVSVLNLSSKKRVQGVVIGRSTVKVQ